MPARSLPQRVRHLVVGAGFGGLGAAIRLDAAGEGDLLVCERAADVGGTWRDNTYPGAACDVPSQLYSYSFAPNPHWTRSFSTGPEIQAYLTGVAERSGVLDRCAFGTEVEQAAWDETALAWRVRTRRDGTSSEVLCDNLVLAVGGLSEPRLPAIPGLDRFAGPLMHSARWDHEVDLAGRRVAVVGTGASAAQIVPALRGVASRVDVYQRTPSWVVPRRDRVYSPRERWALAHLPALRRLYRLGVYWGRECLVPGFTRWPRLAGPARRAALAHLHRAVSDPDLRARLTPAYQIGCKRIVVSSDWYAALAAPDVELVTDPVAEVTPSAVVTDDGTARPADVIVAATGFRATDPPMAHRVRGRGGRTLAQVWDEGGGMAAYKGTTVRGFPNLFWIVGPNTGLGHSSVVFVIECQLAYLVDAVRRQRRHGWAAMEPRADAQAAWNHDLQRRLARSVWNTGGCSSWYLDDRGRNTTLWPRATFTLRRELRRFDPPAYEVSAGTAA